MSILKKCIKCQKGENLSTPSKGSIKTFCNAAEIQQDEVYRRIADELDNIKSGNVHIVWHRECYKAYTHSKMHTCCFCQKLYQKRVKKLGDVTPAGAPRIVDAAKHHLDLKDLWTEYKLLMGTY